MGAQLKQHSQEGRGDMDFGGKRRYESGVEKHSEYVEMKLRQKLREESVELRELESKLRMAYVNKELHAQVAEKEAEKLAQQYREEVAAELLRRKWSEEAEAVEEQKKNLVASKAQYRQELWEQEKREAEERRCAAYQDFLREKILIDEIVQQIHEEDQREMLELMLKKKKTKSEMDEFRRCQEVWKEKERLALKEENRRIILFINEKEDFECKLHMAAKEREKAKAEITKSLMDVIQEEQDKRQQREETHQMLLEEEVRMREEGQVQLRVREALLRKQEERMAQEWERQNRLERLAKEAQEEASEQQKMLEQMADEERLEQLGNERRRRKKLEHRKVVEALLEERRRDREDQIATLREEQRRAKGEEEARRLAIEYERLQMLREHATKLIGYLPKGVLREDDLPLLDLKDESGVAVGDYLGQGDQKG